MKAATRTKVFDPADHLTTPDAQAELLSDALETGEATYIAAALGTIARARGMSALAEETGLTREGLYKSLSASGDPRLSTVMGVLKALRIELKVAVPETMASTP